MYLVCFKKNTVCIHQIASKTITYRWAFCLFIFFYSPASPGYHPRQQDPVLNFRDGEAHPVPRRLLEQGWSAPQSSKWFSSPVKGFQFCPLQNTFFNYSICWVRLVKPIPHTQIEFHEYLICMWPAGIFAARTSSSGPLILARLLPVFALFCRWYRADKCLPRDLVRMLPLSSVQVRHC